MNIEELKQRHKGWLINPNTSRGQLEDSKTILNLIEELEAARAEVGAARIRGYEAGRKDNASRLTELDGVTMTEYEAIEHLQSQLEQARQSNEAMREALRFYAKANHYQSCICGGHLPSLDYPCPMCNGELTAIEEDNGIRARQALDAAGFTPVRDNCQFGNLGKQEQNVPARQEEKEKRE